MTTYINIDTNVCYTESELKHDFELFKAEMQYESFEEYLEAMLDMGKQGVGGLAEVDRIWYAVLQDSQDSDWGTGSYDLEEAKKKCLACGGDAYIAVISEGNDPICIEEIRQEDF